MPQRVKDGAFGCRVSRTFGCGSGEDGLDAAKVGDLGAHIAQMALGPGPHLPAGLRAVVDEREEATDLLDGEAQIAPAHDETKARNMPCPINTVARRRSGWVGHHADLLIIADGFEVAARSFGEVGPPVALFRKAMVLHPKIALESVAATDLTQ